MIDSPVTDRFTLNQGYIYRNDFVFVRGSIDSTIFDRLVIRTPQRARSHDRQQGFSCRSLNDHIELVNKLHIRKVLIYCDDLSFLLQCSCVQDVIISPSYDANADFDYMPLYQMPDIHRVSCATIYGTCDQYKTTIDYSQMPHLEYIAMYGSGHTGYESLHFLREVWMSNVKQHKDFRSICCSKELRKATILQSGLHTLDGIEKYSHFSSLVLYNNYSIRDISALKYVAGSLTELVIENCSRIKDFSVLEYLVNLEHLQLYGNNVLPNLDFLRQMTKLKTFTFTMNIEDGELSLCLNLPYASCRDRKHYNLKDAQLPKLRIIE